MKSQRVAAHKCSAVMIYDAKIGVPLSMHEQRSLDAKRAAHFIHTNKCAAHKLFYSQILNGNFDLLIACKKDL